MFLVAVFLLSAGFAKIMAICVNWVCAQRLAKKYVFADKFLNLLLVAAYPLALVIGLGWRGPRLLSGGTLPQIPWGWWPAIALGGVGFLLLVRATIRYWRYRPPECVRVLSSETVDLRRPRPGFPPPRSLIGARGRMRHVARLPGNEQLTFELSTQACRLPRLPPGWEGLSIVHLSDFHFYGAVTKAYFETLCEHAAGLKPDLFVFSGDLLDDQRLLDWLPDTLGRLKAPHGQYFVLGNHDWYLDPAATRAEFARLGWTDVSRSVARVPATNQAAPLILCGDESPWMGSHPDLTDAPTDAFRILVSHTPDNIGWAREQRIDLMLAGHTHGGQIRLPILGPVYSPSLYGCRFASGVFWLDPTLMYVSRGVSGKDPIRYNCRPEVTKLVLHQAGG